MSGVPVIILLAVSAAGCLFMLVAASVVHAFAQKEAGAGGPSPAVTILKPLHGDEPDLLDNLATFCRQSYAGSLQIIFGVASPVDAAIPVVEKLKAAFPQNSIALVVQAANVGGNPKVANLVNMSAQIAHGIIVIADSDIRVPENYLRRVIAALDRQGSGAVTCPYYGIAAGGLWSWLSRLNIDGHFLPGVMVGAYFKLSRPCMGSTIALSRRSLAAIGGFEAVADCLADDYALGEALAKHGEPVGVLPFAVGHVCSESSATELWQHEVRWARTIRAVDPLGYLGWLVAHPFPFALAALGLGGGFLAFWLALAALACRAGLLAVIGRAYGLPKHPYWLIPFRDLLSFAIFIAGFIVRDVSWRKQRYRLQPEGALMPERRSPSP